MKRLIIIAMAAAFAAIACSSQGTGPLPRTAPSPQLDSAWTAFKDTVAKSVLNPDPNFRLVFHNIMIVKDGKVVIEDTFDPEWPAERPQHVFSASKTLTALAVGLAVDDGLMTVEDKVTDYFPDKLPEEVSDNLKALKVKDLLTMQCGHATDPTWDTMAAYDTLNMELPLKPGADLAAAFFNHPFVFAPGTFFCYNSLCTYMASAIVQKVTGKTIRDYLDERVFKYLGIQTPEWDMDEDGVCCGGWGLHLRMEDMAKIGQLMLQKGLWGDRQLISAEWIDEQTRKHIDNYPNGLTREQIDQPPFYPIERNDWVAGYGYQTWRNTVGGYRADGAWGQMIIVLPEKNAVIAARANLVNHQVEEWAFWDFILPAL